MTYSETLEWMFAQLPMFQKQGKIALNAKLDKILQFSRHLDYPHKKFKSVHVAGTNGKGSSSHMLASILQEAGYKVGLYTSPHLKDFRERIRINGNLVSKRFVIDFVKKNQSFFDEHQLSFFEMTVGMAFDYFAEEKVDIAIIEVGLGGRLDSTNIIIPEVSLITNIGLDHTDILGNTLSKIALEKAGIIKEGIPVVISEYQEEIAEVFENMARSKNTELEFGSIKVMPHYKTDLHGAYQKNNSKGVVTAIKRLSDFNVKEKDIKAGLQKVVQNTGLLGRWQQIGSNPKIVCDTAHNKEGLVGVLDQLYKEEYETLHVVLGFVKDKDLASMLPMFPQNAKYYFCKPNINRGLDSEILLEKASVFGLKGDAFKSVCHALKEAKNAAKTSDFIFIGGSNFVVAEVV